MSAKQLEKEFIKKNSELEKMVQQCKERKSLLDERKLELDYQEKEINKKINIVDKFEKKNEELEIKMEKFEQQKKIFYSFENEIKQCKEMVDIYVDGELFSVSKKTLLTVPNTYFTNLLVQNSKNSKFHTIDRDKKHFKLIINYLRKGAKQSISLVNKLIKMSYEDISDMYDEAIFYGLKDLAKIVKRCSNRFDSFVCDTSSIEFRNCTEIITNENRSRNSTYIIQDPCISGKRYVEILLIKFNGIYFGVVENLLNLNRHPGYHLGIGLRNDGYYYHNNDSMSKSAPSFDYGDRAGILVDMDKKTLQYYKNQKLHGPQLDFTYEKVYIAIYVESYTSSLGSTKGGVKIVHDTEFMDIE